MNGYEIKQALASGKSICGTLIVSPSPKWLKYIGQTGIDFVFIDSEHVMTDSMTLSWMCTAYAAMGLAPIVRIPSADPARATQVLDGGAQGILVPYMESVETLREMVGAVHYKPIKGEKLRGMLDGSNPFPHALSAELEAKNRNNMLFVNIESLTALDQLDALLAVKGLDGIVVGPNDLSYSMDIPNHYDDPAFQENIVKILSCARQKGIAAGVHALGGIEQQMEWARKSGMNMLWHSGDLYAFVASMQRDILWYKSVVSGCDSAASEIEMEI